ncbi:8-amino-7-oxononanoate synthase [Marinospirillum alkaliphilum]|uniref:8-amino-7-oxononanoate synthase n=1 Tax=Marinospirillum alkaliphilum DSM 21637 TaxID=1122209 RepID=A0A1K1Z0R1_9GAMM|nr:8-amino-7-oxononanoate synthase [Marinospirillum alkaliphilum]SFX67149.1 8-amino-7-oxononanoate synthase [Marinospirillum alkaliphilum DSM 21637]
MPDYGHLQQRLEQRRQQHLWRQPPLLQSAQGVVVQVEGQSLINFSSNDYLGLAADVRLQQALAEGASQWGVGSGASHRVCGHQLPHRQLEERLAALTGREAALLFSSGYQANLAAIQTLFGSGDRVLQDRLNHASLLDAGLASGANFRRYQHLDSNHLQQLLDKPHDGQTLVVTDSVFSMDGDQADLAGLARLCQRHKAWLMVDDAHGLGVLGSQGEGSCGAALPASQVPLLMGTLGKALGTAGAFIAADQVVIDYLQQFARTHIYTTAQPAALAVATLKALDLLAQEPERRQHLHDLIQYFRRRAAQLGLPLMPSDTAIQPLLLGSSARALHWSARLREAGLLVMAIRPPTVPRGQARLRITLTASHQMHQVDQLLNELEQLQQQEPLAFQEEAVDA